MENVCLKLQKKCIKTNQLIQGANLFEDGASGDFQNLDNINTDMDNPSIDNVLYLTGGASMQVEVNQLGTVLMEGDSNIALSPNSEYYITGYVYESIDPPPTGITDYFLDLDKTGWIDATFVTIERFQLTNTTEGKWHKLVAKMVTGLDINGKIRIVQSGTYIPNVDGELFHIDTVSLSEFIPYFGDEIIYDPQITLPVEQNVDATIILKVRDLEKPSFFFQRSKTRAISIPSTKESEKNLGFAHDVGSIRGDNAFNSEYLGELQINGTPVLKGVFKFDELKTLNCNNSYIGKLLSDNRIWMSLLENYSLCDLNWQEYDFLHSINNLEANWQENGDTVAFIAHIFEARDIPNVIGNSYRFFANDFRIGHFMKPLIRKLFRHIGYSVSFNGDFLNSQEFRDDFLTGITESFFIRTEVPDIIYYGYQLSSTVIANGQTEFPNYEESEFDPNSYISGNCVTKVTDFEFIMSLHFEIWTGTSYSAPEGDALFTLPAISIYDGGNVCSRAEFILDTVAAASSDHAYWIKVELYQGATVIDTQYIYDSNEPLWDTDNLTIVQTTDLGNGDWRIDYLGQGGSNSHFFGASVMIGTGDQQFYTELKKPANPLSSGALIGQSPYCVNLKELMVSISGTYNLISETDESTNTVNLWQRDDYYRNGTDAINADEIATNGEVVQKRLGGKNGKKYIFAYPKNDTDIWFEENAPTDFGNFTYDNTVGSSGDAGIEMSSGNILNASFDWEPLVGVWVPRYQKKPDVTARFGYRILHYDGYTPIPPPSVLEVTGNVPGVFPVKSFAFYPRATFQARVGFGSTNLSFSDNSDIKGLVSKHFQDELDLISKARILSAYFYINSEFVRKLDYSKFWKYKDSLFILNRIVDYRYMLNAPTRVELVPINTFYGTDDKC